MIGRLYVYNYLQIGAWSILALNDQNKFVLQIFKKKNEITSIATY